MAFQPLTTLLADCSDDILDPNIPAMITVNNVTMDFNSANQQLNSLKEYFIAAAKRELMFKRFRALDNISLTVQKGDVYGILGTNGSGKSTLLKIVSGVLEPTEGSVDINGRIAPLIELGAGFDYELTARENIYLNGALLGYPKKFIDEHFEDIVEFAEIREFLDMPLKNYSSGMVSRIAFAIATVIIPEILIVDEVLAVGDFMFRQKCEKRIQSLIHEHGTTVLIVSHSSDQIERLCNKAVWIEKGHLRMIGPARDVSRAYQALGGHTGTAEEESALFSLLNAPISPATEMIETIAGDDHYATNAVVAGKVQSIHSRDAVVIGPGEDVNGCFVALGLAGALNAQCLISRPDRLPETTITTLANIAPQLVYYLRPSIADEQVLSSIRAAVPRNCEIHTISYDKLDQLSLEVFDIAHALAIKQPVFSHNFVFVSTGQPGSAMATLSPVAARGVPCCVVTEASNVESFINKAREAQIEKLVILDNDHNDIVSQLKDQALSSGIEVDILENSCSDQANERALQWVANHIPADNAVHSIYFASQGGTIDAISAGQLIAEDEGLLLSINHNDMASMTRALRVISDQKNTLERMVVLGGSACFNSVDKTIFGKAASSKR